MHNFLYSRNQMFQKGNNLGGFAEHQRRLYRQFYRDAFKIWKEDGEQALRIMAHERPSEFCKMFASMAPKQVDITTESNVTHTLDFSTAIKELQQLTNTIGQHNLDTLPHNRVLEHTTITDEE